MPILLNPRVIAGIALALFLAFSHFTAYRKGAHSVRVDWDAAKVQAERSAQEQASRIRDLQRAAELRYVVQRDTQDRFIVTTVREIASDAAPLAACPLPDRLRVRLNDAAACARGDTPASCGPAGEVPSP